MTCKDCVHYEVCETHERVNRIKANLCGLFKNKADYAEVKHGKWIKKDNCPNKDHILAECPFCHFGEYLKKFVDDPDGEKTFKHFCEYTRYCLACGAKMESEASEE